MEPKILRAINFLDSGGNKVTITSIENSKNLFNSKNSGTII